MIGVIVVVLEHVAFVITHATYTSFITANSAQMAAWELRTNAQIMSGGTACLGYLQLRTQLVN